MAKASDAERARSDRAAQIASAARPAPDPAPAAERECAISIPHLQGPVPVFPTEAGDDEFTQASARKLDEAALNVVISSNGGFWVPKGTKCLWLHRGLLTSQVRILEGKFAGQVGWLDREWSEGAD